MAHTCPTYRPDTRTQTPFDYAHGHLTPALLPHVPPRPSASLSTPLRLLLLLVYFMQLNSVTRLPIPPSLFFMHDLNRRRSVSRPQPRPSSTPTPTTSSVRTHDSPIGLLVLSSLPSSCPNICECVCIRAEWGERGMSCVEFMVLWMGIVVGVMGVVGGRDPAPSWGGGR